MKSREVFIDVARGLAIITMLVGHASAPDIINQLIFGFHMPFFFILSGYLWDSQKWNNVGFYILVKKKWSSYIKPYFILTFINLIINIPVEWSRGLRDLGLLISTIKHIFWIIYSWGSAERMPNCSPLWFLPCLFICSIYFYFLLKIENSYLRFVICVLASYLALFLSKYNVPQLPWHIDSALLGMVFMYIGYNLRKKRILYETSFACCHKFDGGGGILYN